MFEILCPHGELVFWSQAMNFFIFAVNGGGDNVLK